MSHHDRSAGIEYLPGDQARMLRRARRLEWATLAYLAVDVALIALVMGTSQAMQAAFVQDALALIPPIAFLIGVRITRRAPSPEHPYGYHRAIGISHLVAAMALFAFGALLLSQSATSLFTAERPSIGGVSIFGHTVWAGWLMIAVMVAGGVPPLVLGRMKLKLAEPLHNRVLYADAQMNKADWLSSAATILGVLGTGVGLWWTDAAAAIIISIDILFDGLKNLRNAANGLIDARPAGFDDKAPHPLLDEVDDYLEGLDWVRTAGCRIRDEGQVFHVEAFVVPHQPEKITMDQLDAARRGCLEADWKIHDVVLAPVSVLPSMVHPEAEEATDDDR